ncbi:TonB-dependent receptor plug domain-containing protein [Sphingomonas canadensis]|uniref:TonB-dependent receptor plug domain-containing protein n=1 Tax=Sphingomonas canadensis TaxID=1219257 RepID=A0ABW3H829_9SPHN|nr:TonB-dependent receptor [Sphingomonas canadensis]MCW3836379.1 TonB-dependent receptor [Sphingomonas canadensis]
MKLLVSILFSSAALLPAVSAHAQIHSDDADGGRAYYVEQEADDLIVVASGVAQQARESGRAVTVLDRATIEQRQAVSLADLLATTPGVTLSRNGGPGAVTAVRVRGAEDAQTLVLIDGVRANDPSSPAGAFDFGNLLAGAIERVELLRGPNSVVWGSQAIGGVVNVVTKQPEAGLSARASAEYGYADQVSANAAISGGSDRVQGALTGGWFRTDGVSQAASGTEPDGYRQYSASGRLKVELIPGVRGELGGYWADSRTDLDGYPPPSYGFTDTAEYSTAREFYGYAGLHADVGPVANRLSFTVADIDRDNFDPAAGAAPLYFYRGHSERFAYGGDARVADALRLVFGAERERLGFFDGASRFRSAITSFYGQAIVTPVEAVTVTAGVRNDDHSRFGSHASWGASMALRPASGTLLRAAYGEGFKAPTLYQLFAPFYGTGTLDPETAKSYELGAEQELIGGALRIAASWFHRDTHNQIDFDLGSFTYRNIARTRTSGVELEIAARPAEGLTFTASYSFIDAENRSPGYAGNRLARRPRDSASVSADWRTPLGLALGATVTIVGDSFDDAGNFTRLDGYALAAIRAEMPVSAGLSLYGRVENLFDERYQTVAGYGTYGRAAYAGVRVRLP